MADLDSTIRKHITTGAADGQGACLIAYAILELVRAYEKNIAAAPFPRGMGDLAEQISKAIVGVNDRIGELADTILSK